MWNALLGGPLVYLAATRSMYYLGNVLCFLAGALFIYVAIRTVLGRDQVFWNRSGNTLQIRYGTPWDQKAVSIPRDQALVELRLCSKEQAARSIVPAGSPVLVLRKYGQDEQDVWIASSKYEEELTPALRAIRDFLGSTPSDETGRNIALPDGTTLTTSSLPLNYIHNEFADLRLFFPATNIALYKRPLGGRLLSFFMFLLCVGGSGLLFAWGLRAGFAVGLLLWSLAMLILICGGNSFLVGSGTQSVTADRIQRRISFRSGVFGGYGKAFSKTSYGFDQIACLQLCKKGSQKGKNSVLDSYELNLVLKDPSGERIHITNQTTERPLREDAHKFSEFLGTPLVDHT